RRGGRRDGVRRRTARCGSGGDPTAASISWTAGERRRRMLSTAAALATIVAACGPAPVEKLDPAKVDVLRGALGRTSAEPTPQPVPSPRKSAAAARSAKEQRARAEAALPRGRALGILTPIGSDGRFAFTLDAPRGQKPGQSTTLSLMNL